jgi:hypothetical protein
VSPTERVRCGCGAEGDLMPDGSFLCMDCWYARPQPKRRAA